MSKVNKIRLFGITIFAAAVVYLISVSYFDRAKTEPENMINVYFFNAQTASLEPERREMPEGNYLEIALELWDMLVRGPESASLSGVFPENLVSGVGGSVNEIRNLQPTQEDRGVRQFEVDLRHDYLELSPIDEIIFRSAVVWTFTELDWISDVAFFVDNSPLTRLDGGAVGLMNRDNVLINPQITMEHIVRRTVDLYFVNSSMTGLVAERRTIEIPSNLTVERVVLKELMRGPNSAGLISLIPPETVINDVYTESLTMTCYVDLNAAFDTRLTSVTHTRQLAVHSIVTTLISLSSGSNINSVQFLINGERVPGRGIEIDLSQPFELNESIIIPRVEMELL